MERDIFQKQYDFELEQRNRIASATNIPIVALTILGGALSSMIIGFKYLQGIETYAFIVVISISIASMIFSLYCVVRTFLGYSYQKIPSARELSVHLSDLEKWHLDNGESTSSATQKAKNDFTTYFDNRLSEAAEHNSSNNIRRGNYLHDATAAVTVAFIFLMISSPFYIYQKVVKDNQIHQVRVVNTIKLINEEQTMNEKTENGGTSDSQKETPAASPSVTPKKTAAPKPIGPENVIFKGSVDIKNIKTVSTSNTDSSENGKGKK